MSNIILLIELLLVINTIAAVVTVFSDKRDIASIWAWLMVLILFPGIGFIIYAFFGRRLSHEKIFDMRTQASFGIDEIADNQKALLQHNAPDKQDPEAEGFDFLNLFLNNDEAILTRRNEVELFKVGAEKFGALFEDMRAATHHINVEYFSIINDEVGNKMIDILTEKARQGVRVRVIYDQWGSHGRNDKMYRKLREAGGQVEAFLQPRWIPITFRANFRLHRKIVVIDGEIGYIGGFNVGDEYMGLSKKFGHWRDTHARIKGDAVLSLQNRFFMDWNATVREEKLDFSKEYFPTATVEGDVDIQVVTSGPDTDTQQIKQGYLRAIASARESIIIQTPYFVPDQGVLDMLQIAALSGVKVQLMIPSMPDHPFVYRATEYYAQEMLASGVEVYAYQNGFLHAKVISIDGKISSVGSANMDMRSFDLNFEGVAFMYNEKIAQQLQDLFAEDLKESQRLDADYFAKQSAWRKFKQKFSRLLSPIL